MDPRESPKEGGKPCAGRLSENGSVVAPNSLGSSESFESRTTAVTSWKRRTKVSPGGSPGLRTLHHSSGFPTVPGTRESAWPL
ncbi:hypothetical protein BSLG_003679 [Batrachochytrium salamandrivorans]|nr:hypothetical protein BSLG_003679 [Batrachochytrium salamandrivorans]